MAPAPCRPAILCIRRIARRYPEHGAVLAVALAWTAVLMVHGAPSRLGVMPERAHQAHSFAARGAEGALAAGVATLPLWTLMCIAMMVPGALPAARHVGRNTLRWRRQRAVGEFLLAYVAVWVAFGLLALSTVTALAGLLAGEIILTAALAAAAIWQVLPYQRRFLRACHRTVPLPPKGWLAAAGCARFGLRHGRACVGVCWPLMLVMAVVVHGSVLWMAVLSAILVSTKLLPRSDRVSRPLACGLGGVALVILLAGPVSAVDAKHGGPDHRGGLSSASAGSAFSRVSSTGSPWLCRRLVPSGPMPPRATTAELTSLGRR